MRETQMFTRSLTVFRVRGIPIRLHWSLLFILPFLVYAGAYQFEVVAARLGIPPHEMGVSPFVWGLLLAIGLLVSIVLHELAHAFVGMRGGARIRSITLMMLGGVTRMEKEGPPEREAWMALAGPLTSFAIAAVAYFVYRFMPMPAGLMTATFVFAAMNAILGAFNLLPAFPMDGGRVLRGLLVRWMDLRRATRIAARVGQGMAVVLGILGFMSFNVMLILIAFFVYVGASAEEQHLATRELLQGMTVKQLMTDRLSDARPTETAAQVARRLIAEHAVAARIIEEPRPTTTAGMCPPMGVVTLWDLARGAAEADPGAAVSGLFRKDLPVVHPGDDAVELLDLVAGQDSTIAVVVDACEEVVGLVTPADIERAMLFGSIERARPH
jgi:Zn-dependent protease/predicted transcriptional regulator